MDKRQARALLEEERRRLERLRASVAADRERVAGAPEGAEDLVDEANRRVGEETDEAVARQLGNRLQALERAEARLAAGTYGRSVLSGRPIPDERLEAARLSPSREPFQVLEDPAVQDNQLVEDDETTFDEPPPELDPGLKEERFEPGDEEAR
ncbi:MAG TPA: hypothetical protein VN907_07670 [Actinomycetes bacterium]|nr:hypothetical protein [Actinomycetes bacterium]